MLLMVYCAYYLSGEQNVFILQNTEIFFRITLNDI